MKVLFILEAGIPEYRNFLFERLSNEKEITDLLILHNGKIYNGKGTYKSKKLRFIGNYKLGFYIGVWKYIKKYDVVVSSYNLRNISCWLPVFFKKNWILWGKGLGSNESFVVKFVRKLTAKNVKLILVYNQFKKEELIKTLRISERKVIAYNNTIYISNAGINSGVEKEYFLYFGRIQERKGLIELIQEYKKYLENNMSSERLKLRFVGNGAYKEALIREVDKMKLKNFVDFFPGVYDDESIKEHFMKAKAYVSPYNVGLAVVNSFSYGVPVITCSEPQEGPEFYYLNKINSFVINNITELSNILENVGFLNSDDFSEEIYKYYINNLKSEKMYDEFYKAIKSPKDE